MGLQSIVTNCGYLLAMMGMPGMFAFSFFCHSSHIVIAHIILTDIFPMCRLNDMWTISLQDREHACWEEVSMKH